MHYLRSLAGNTHFARRVVNRERFIDPIGLSLAPRVEAVVARSAQAARGNIQMDGQIGQGAQSNRPQTGKRFEAVSIAVAYVYEILGVHFLCHFLVHLAGREEEAVCRLVSIPDAAIISWHETNKSIFEDSSFVVYLTPDIGWQIQDGSCMTFVVMHRQGGVISRQLDREIDGPSLGDCKGPQSKSQAQSDRD